MPLPDEIMDESSVLFRDVRPEHVDPEVHAAFVIARVLDHGTVRSVGALLRYYGRIASGPSSARTAPIECRGARCRSGRPSSS